MLRETANRVEHYVYQAMLDTGIPRQEVVVDVGENAGIMTNYYAKNPSVSRVFTFEASSLTFQRLTASVCLNSNSDKVQLFNYGVLEATTDLDLWLFDSPEHSGMTRADLNGQEDHSV